MKKTAVILMNLGGPDSLDAVRPFLFNLFYDPAIIRYPNPFRFMIASAISLFRFGYSKKIYEKLGGKSPILDETIRQKNALDASLNDETIRSFIYMRYWHPMVEEVVLEVKEYNPDQIILLPLYPQFSTTTTQSSIDEIMPYLKDYEVKFVEEYHNFDLFIDAHVDQLRMVFNPAMDFSKVILFFSAHSIPEKFVIDGDPYQLQTEESVRLIMNKLFAHLNKTDADLKYEITYQSKVGRMKWLTPATEDKITEYAKLGYEIYLVPISFVSEHSETLVELDMDYKEVAYENGAKNYVRLPTLSVHPLYIEALKQLVQGKISE